MFRPARFQAFSTFSSFYLFLSVEPENTIQKTHVDLI